MFDYSLTHWLTFFGAGLMLELVPGPDLLFIAAQTGRYGRGHGFAAMFGIWTGALVHIAATVCGLAAVLAQSAAAFSIVKWLGAGYLVWLGLQSLWQAGHNAAPDKSALRAPSRLAAYRQGILIDLLNPKVALFFLAFIPQFVVPGAGPVAVQLALHGVLLARDRGRLRAGADPGRRARRRDLAASHTDGRLARARRGRRFYCPGRASGGRTALNTRELL